MRNFSSWNKPIDRAKPMLDYPTILHISRFFPQNCKHTFYVFQTTNKINVRMVFNDSAFKKQVFNSQDIFIPTTIHWTKSRFCVKMLEQYRRFNNLERKIKDKISRTMYNSWHCIENIFSYEKRNRKSKINKNLKSAEHNKNVRSSQRTMKPLQQLKLH